MRYFLLLILSFSLLPAWGDTPLPLDWQAQGRSQFSRSGWYLQLGTGPAFNQFNDQSPLAIDRRNKRTFGLGLQLGKRLNRYIAVEGSLGYRRFRHESSLLGIAPNKQTVSSWDMNLRAKGFITSGAWQFYLLAGGGLTVMKMDQKITVTGFNNQFTHQSINIAPLLTAGGGINFYLNRHWYLGLESSYMLPIMPFGKSNLSGPFAQEVGYQQGVNDFGWLNTQFSLGYRF